MPPYKSLIGRVRDNELLQQLICSRSRAELDSAPNSICRRSSWKQSETAKGDYLTVWGTRIIMVNNGVIKSIKMRTECLQAFTSRQV